MVLCRRANLFTRSPSGFLASGDLPRKECHELTAVPSTALYADATFAVFSIAQQLAAYTDDGSRRLSLRRREVRLLGDRPDGRVLDLMCGVGAYVAALEAEGRMWIDYLGVDVSPVALRVARQRYGSWGARFCCQDVTAEDLLMHGCDTVLLMYEAINNLGREGARTVLCRIGAALEPGGRALLDVQLSNADRAAPTGAAREATVLDPGTAAPVAGAGVVASRTVPVTSTSVEQVTEHHVHWLDRTGCLYHVGYRWWEPSWSFLLDLFGAAGLRVVATHQVHRCATTTKPSIRSSRQFVLAAAR